MGSIGGQASGDFLLSSGALRILYSLIKDSITVLSDDAYTQSNPSVITAVAARSTTLPATVKNGVLGGSVAFTRPDVAENTVGGAFLVGGSTYTVGTRPLGLFINDALGNEFENAPAVGSGKGPFLRGGACGVKIYETEQQTTNGGGSVGDDLTYAVGDKLYASVNGLLTNRWQDTFEFQWIDGVSGSDGGDCIEPDVTRMGTVLAPPDAASSEMFVALAFI